MPISCVRTIIFAILASLSFAAQADVYRCVGSDGRTLYSDSPCPRDAVEKSNITTSVGACNTAECEAKRQQEAGDARERLRAAKNELADLSAKRQLEENEVRRERARLDELRWRESIEARLAAAAQEAADAAAYLPYYPALLPGVKPCGWRCGNAHHRSHAAGPPAERQRGVSIRMER
jgi:TolA-binding protein